MKRKFNFFLIIFLFFITSNSYASLSPQCFNLFEEIKNSKLPNVQNFQRYENSTYGFDPIWILKRDKNNEIILEENEADWVIKRNKNNFPYVGRITSSKILSELRYGDIILSVDGKSLDTLNDDEVRDLLLITKDNQNINSNLIFERDGKKFELNLDLITDLIQDDKVRIVIGNISEISQKKSTFKADVYLDVEVDFDYETENLPLAKIMFNNLVYKDAEGEWQWQQCLNIPHEKIVDFNIPDPGSSIILLNAVNMNLNNEKTVIDIFPWSDKIGDDVDYDYTQIVSITNGYYEFKNKFDLKTFPFDKQKLVFEIAQINNFDEYAIDYKTYTSRALDSYVKKGNINGWNLKGYEIKNTVFKGPVGENYSGIEIILEIERQTGYYIYKVILPILLILMVCWSVMWINPEELESKLTITIVCLLSLIAYNFVIDKELPKLEYLTVLDWIILISYVYATIPNFLSIYLFSLFKKKQKSKINKFGSLSKQFGPISYVIVILLIIIINVNLNPDTSGKLIAWLS